MLPFGKKGGWGYQGVPPDYQSSCDVVDIPWAAAVLTAATEDDIHLATPFSLGLWFINLLNDCPTNRVVF